jgi:TP901 family phage tail tape measure protein
MAQVETLVNRITADISGLKAGYKGAAAETKKLQKGFQSFSGALRRIFVGGGFALGIKASIDFRREMALTGTLIAGQTEKLNKYARTVQDMSIQYNQSTSTLAEGAFLVQSAFAGQDDITQKLAITTKAAAAGNATAAESLRVLSAFTKGYGDTSDEAFEKASDLVFKINELGQTTFRDLASSMGRVIPVAAAMNVSQEELAAGFATLTGVTGDAAEVSTQLSGILRAMIKPTTGMKEAVKALGYENAQALVKQEGMIGAMRKLISTTDGSAESIGKLFRRAEAMTALFALTGGQAEVFDQKLIAMNESAGATEAAFKEISDGINKTGFEMGQAGKAFIVATQRIFDTATQTDEFSQSMRTLRDILSSSEFQGAMSWLLARVLDLVAALPRLFFGIGELIQQSQNLTSQANRQQQEFKTLEKQLLNFAQTIKMSSWQYEVLMQAIIAAGKTTGDYADKTRSLLNLMKTISAGGLGEEVADQYKKWQTELRNGIPIIEKSTDRTKQIDAALNDFFKDIDSGTKKTGGFKKEIEEMLLPVVKVEKSIDLTGDAIGDLSKEIDKNIKLDLALAEAFGEIDEAAEESEKSISKKKQALIDLGKGLSWAANFAVEFAGEIGKLAGLSDSAARGLDALANGTKSLFSGDIIGGASALIGNLENIGALIFGSGDKAKEAAEDFEKWLSFSTELAREFGIVLSDEMNAALAIYIQNLQEGTAAGETFLDFWNRMNNTIEQGTASLWGFGTQLDINTEQLNEYQLALRQAAALSDDLVKKNTLDSLDELERITAGGADSLEELEKQTRFAEIAFDNLVRAGVGPGEIISNLDQIIQNLEKSAGSLGATGVEALNRLKRFRELADTNKDLISDITDLTTLYEGFSQTGAFDPDLSQNAKEDFDSFVDSAIKQFEALKKAGFAPAEALQFMTPILQKIREDAALFGLELSEDAQKLIEGLDPAAVDPMTQAIEGLTAVIEKLAEKLGVDFGTAAEEAGDKIRDNIGAELENLNRIRMPSLDNFSTPGAGTMQGGGGMAAGGQTNITFENITLPTNIETRATSRDVRQIIEDNVDQVMTIIKEKLEGI